MTRCTFCDYSLTNVNVVTKVESKVEEVTTYKCQNCGAEFQETIKTLQPPTKKDYHKNIAHSDAKKRVKGE